jgi:ADP-ribose pyrophosphatase YjhB (NUDIX family)
LCGAGLLSSILKDNEPPRLVCHKCGFIFYLDPKLVACSIVEMDHKIVLLKRAIEPQIGRWVVPGGYVEQGEKVEAAAMRETEEECGLKTRIKDLLGIYSYPGRLAVVVAYVAEHLSGRLIIGDETQEVKLCGPQEIPWDYLAFPSTVDALRDYFRIETVG